MKLTFYGVRGSIPAPGISAVKYGGNTPCIHIESDNDFHIILDSGTGIITLGDKLIEDHQPIYLLLSHNHWDHIQGFPFFRPAYQAHRVINILSGITHPLEPKAILNQFNGTYFPISNNELLANISFIKTQNITDVIHLGNIEITRKLINHPSSGSAYLFRHDKNSFAYITDNELQPPIHQFTNYTEWVDFIQNIDLLIHDAQYLPNEFPAKLGWGHSSYDQVVDLAIEANVGTLCLFSHDYRRSDDEVDKMIALAKKRIKDKNSTLTVFAARELCGFTVRS